MSRPRCAALLSLLCLFAGTACGEGYLPTSNEPYDGGVKCCGWEFKILAFSGYVTSAASGEPLLGVTVRLEAPARGWSATALTDSTGYYLVLDGPAHPAAGDCAGLSVSFSHDGYQTLRLVDFPLVACTPGIKDVSARLTPTP